MATKFINQPLNDRTPFWGTKTTPEFKYLQQAFSNKIQQVTISRNLYRDLLKRNE